MARTNVFRRLGSPYPDGRQAELFSSDNARTVLRHFQWMRDYGIDGAWLQQFLVGLPGGLFPAELPFSLASARPCCPRRRADRPRLGHLVRYRPHAG